MNIEDELATNLTVDECEELASSLCEDAGALPPGPKKQEIEAGAGLSQSQQNEAVGDAEGKLTMLDPVSR
jgi:hypothetical protein